MGPFFYASAVLLGGAIGLFTYWLGATIRPRVIDSGPRGSARERARKDALFRTAEPVIQAVAAWVALLPIAKVRKHVSEKLEQAQHWLGLDADEFLSMALLCAALGSLFMFGVLAQGQLSVLVVIGALVGALLPYLMVVSEGEKRVAKAEMELPGAIDLATLCMGAGLDFPATLQQVVLTSESRSSVLVREIEQILHELKLGRTRAQALRAFAERVPSTVIRDFVSAVIQAEAKGTPLAEALSTQAGVLRSRRSLQIEERAARSLVLVAVPMVLVLASVVALIMGAVWMKFSKDLGPAMGM